MLERVALKCGAVVLLCRPPWSVVERNWASRKGQELVQEQAWMKQVYDGYANVRTDLDFINFDYTTNDLTKEQMLESLIGAFRSYKPPATGIGHWNEGSVLLVGDRVSKRGFPDMPFVSFNEAGCSAWLARQLEAWKVPESKLYWVNSHDLAPDFMGRADAPSTVVALGQFAAQWCRRAGLPYTEVEHPQYWKRFHASEEYTSLKEALAHAVV